MSPLVITSFAKRRTVVAFSCVLNELTFWGIARILSVPVFGLVQAGFRPQCPDCPSLVQRLPCMMRTDLMSKSPMRYPMNLAKSRATHFRKAVLTPIMIATPIEP
jgi:hypothetical protein